MTPRPHLDARGRPAGRHGTPYRAAQRAAHPHRGDPGDAQRRRSASGSASAPGTRRRQLSGVSHFLEHLLFKGTQQAHRAGHLRRDRGGRRRDQRLHHQGVHLLLRAGARRRPAAGHRRASATWSPTRCSPTADVETERGVILEEIAMHDDEPGDEVHDLFAEAIYGDHPLGRLISGTVETISPMTRRQIHGFYRRRYTAPRDRGRRRRQPRPRHGGPAGPGGASPARPLRRRRRPRPRRTARPTPRRRAAPAARSWCATRTPSRRTWCSAAPASARDDERRFALGVLNNVLGGGMSQPAVPGDPGEARAGLLGLLLRHASTPTPACSASTPAARPARSTRCSHLTRDELAAVAARRHHRRGAAPAARACSRARSCSGLEDTGSRMSRLGKGELLYGELLAVDELLARVDAVTPDEVNALAAELLVAADVAGRGRPVRRVRVFARARLTWDAVTILSPPPVRGRSGAGPAQAPDHRHADLGGAVRGRHVLHRRADQRPADRLRLALAGHHRLAQRPAVAPAPAVPARLAADRRCCWSSTTSPAASPTTSSQPHVTELIRRRRGDVRLVHRRRGADGLAAAAPLPAGRGAVVGGGRSPWSTSRTSSTVPTVGVILWLRGREQWARVHAALVHAQRGRPGHLLPLPGRAAVVGLRSTAQLPEHVERISTNGWNAIGLHSAGNTLNALQVEASNPVAAMPSLHTAYALMAVVFFLPMVRRALVAAAAGVPAGDDVHAGLLRRALRDRRAGRLGRTSRRCSWRSVSPSAGGRPRTCGQAAARSGALNCRRD